MNLRTLKENIMPIIAGVAIIIGIITILLSTTSPKTMGTTESIKETMATGILYSDVEKISETVETNLNIESEASSAETLETEEIITDAYADTEEIQTLDRTKPLYNVYKDGIQVEVDTELQWYIRDMCENYKFYEKYVYGMILTESTFDANVYGDGYFGLCAIHYYWITNADMPYFTDDWASRDLTDPYVNLLTLTEMWCYARDTYDLDLMTDEGMMRVLYWHNTGNDPSFITESSYYDTCLKYANELEFLQ